VVIEAPKSVVDKRIPASVGTVTAQGLARCLFESGGNDLDAMAMHIGALPWEVTVLDPPELREAMARQAERLARAAGRPSPDASA
jgi:predicted DNA-binding transcriptional regulator YafY